MPRDGSNIYSQPFPDVVEDTTIESTVYNGFTNDVAQDLNAPRPIVAGGTGASSADVALFNLGGEKAAQLVTNYDSHLWIPGSFRSAVGATGAPNGTAAFAGFVYINEALANPPTNSNVIVEARDLTSGAHYTRYKTAGVWSAWVSLDATYVNVTGDTMTGSLIVAAPFIMSAVTATTGVYQFGTGGSRSLSYDGTNFGFAGAPLIVNNTIFAATSSTVGTYQFGTSGTKSLSYDGTNFAMAGGALIVSSSVYSAESASTGTFNFGTSGTKNLSFNGTSYALLGGDLALTTASSKLTVPNAVISAAAIGIGVGGWNAGSALNVENATTAVFPVAIKATDRGILYLVTGASGGLLSYFTQGTVGNNVGQISCTTTTTSYTTTSDGRKKPQREPFSGLDIINQLNPVRHNWINEPDRWSYGVIAQEAVEVLPQMITRGDDNAAKSGDEGFIAWGADYSQAVPVLLRAVQELSVANDALKARVEALEASG